MTKRTAYIVVAVICIFCWALHSHALFTYEMRTDPNSTEQYCTIQDRYAFLESDVLPWFELVFYASVPSFLIISGNIVIIFKVFESRRLRQQQGTEADKNVYRIIPMLLLVSTVYVICSWPVTMVFFCECDRFLQLSSEWSRWFEFRRLRTRNGRKCLSPDPLHFVNDYFDVSVSVAVVPWSASTADLGASVPWTASMILVTFNHSANFFLYLVSGQQFRQWFLEATCCCVTKEEREDGSVTLSTTQVNTSVSYRFSFSFIVAWSSKFVFECKFYSNLLVRWLVSRMKEFSGSREVTRTPKMPSLLLHGA